MLHSELRNLSNHVKDLARSGYPMTPEGLHHVSDVLDDLAARVFALEATAVPFQAREVELCDGSKVVAFPAEKTAAERETATDRDPGGAA